MIPKTTLRKTALVASLFAFLALSLQAQVVSFNDPNFKAALIENPDINTNGDGEIQVSEAEAYTGMMNVAGKDISDLTGIEAFIMLTDLRVHYNNLTHLDVSANTSLEKLHIQNNQISNVYLGANTELEMLRAQNNNLTELVLAENNRLRYLEAQNNNLTVLDIKNGNNTSIYAFNASGNPDLGCIQVDDASYASANWGDDVDASTTFSTDCDYSTDEVVYFYDPRFKNALLADENINTNGDDEIQISETEGVTAMDVSGNDIVSLIGVEEFAELLQLTAHNNNLAKVDVSGMGLDYLGLNNNQLTSLNLGGIVEYLDAEGNHLSCIQTSNPAYYEENANVNVDEGVNFSTDCNYGSGTIVYIPDPAFKAHLVSAYDNDGNGEIQYPDETQYIYSLNISGLGISDLTGIEAMHALETFNCSNNNITRIDTRFGMEDLGIDCSNNQISEIIVGSHLGYLDISNNELTSFTTPGEDGVGFFIELDISNNKLVTLDISSSDYTLNEFDARGNPDLQCIEVQYPEDAEAKWSGYVDEGVEFSTDCEGSSGGDVVYIPDENFKNALLADANINYNGDDEIQTEEAMNAEQVLVSGENIYDLTGIEHFFNIEHLDCSNNNLISLDISKNRNLNFFDCSNNDLTFLNMKTGGFLELYDFDATGNADLQCVQVDNQFAWNDDYGASVDPGVVFRNQCFQDEVDIVLFYDDTFKSLMLDNAGINTNGDHEIQAAEAGNFTGTIDISNMGINNVRGIETFTSIAGFVSDGNNLTALDLSQNTALQTVSVANNQLQFLSIKNGNSEAITHFDATGNEELECIEVDDPSGWSGGADEGATFSSDCGPMNVNMPDRLFLDRAVRNAGLDTNSDGWVQTHEAASFNGTLDITGLDHADENYEFHVDLTGLEAFSELTGFVAYFVGLDSLDVSSLTKLKHLDVYAANLVKLNVQNGNNENFTHFNALYNDFSCVEVDDVAYAEANWSGGVDEGVEFSTDCGGSSGGEVVYIPDQNFKDALLANEDINTNGDGEIQVSEAESYAGQINVAGQGVSDLTGIEAFTALTDLRVHYNSLSTMNLSSNTALKKLHFQNNQVTSIDLSANTELDMIRAQNNDLTELDLSANSNLRYLEVQNNNLTELNIRNGNNTSMYAFNATGNPGLACIQVDDVAYAEANWSDDVDEGASFSTDCGYSSGEVVYIPDQNFKDALLANEAINTNGDDEIQVSETEGVTVVDVGGNGITDLTGIEAFEELLQLIVDNNNLSSLDVSGLGLDYLNVNNNQLNSLNLGGIVEYLDAVGNADLGCIQTSNPGFYRDNADANVDEGTVFLEDCLYNDAVVYIPDPNFKNALLANSEINFNGDDEIQVAEARGYGAGIVVPNMGISDLTGIEAFVNFYWLDCNDNNLTILDVSNSDNLAELYCANNQITDLILDPENIPDVIRAEHNNIQSLSLEGYATEVNLNNNNLTSLRIFLDDSPVSGWNAHGNPDLYCVEVRSVEYAEENWRYAVDEQVTFSTDCSGEPVVYIPDPNFKNALLANEGINTNGDGEIQVSEAEAYTGKIQATGAGVTDITGIEAFINVTDLRVNYNNLTSVDLSSNTNLRQLHLQNNNLTSIDLSANTELEMARLQFNAISSLNVSNLSSLDYLEVSHNQLTSLDVSGLTDLDHLDCQGNDITSLTFNSNNQLHTLWCNHNQLPSIDLSGAPNLVTLIIVYNNLTSLDLSNNIQLVEVAAFNNDLTDIDLSGLAKLTDLDVYINELTMLDVTDNVALERLDAGFNAIAALDVSNNAALIDLNIRENALASLDVSNNPNLSTLIIPFNQLESLNMKNGNNTAIQDFSAEGNPSLKCIQVDNVTYAEANWSDDVDAGASFSTDCSGAVARFGPADESLPESSGPAAEIVLYPVPAVHELRVRAEQLADDTELYLFNVEGQEFYRETISSDGSFETLLNLDEMNLNSGVYYIRLVGEEGSITKKFIKQ